MDKDSPPCPSDIETLRLHHSWDKGPVVMLGATMFHSERHTSVDEEVHFEGTPPNWRCIQDQVM